MKKIVFISFISFVCSSRLFAIGEDTIPYKMFKEDVVLSADVGFYSAPFSLKDNYALGVKKIKFRNNPKIALGFGVAYKWFAIRLGFALPIEILSKSKFNKTQYFDAGLRFNIKQTYSTLEFRNYKGYVIKDAQDWNDSVKATGIPNEYNENTTSLNISANVWWFKSKNFNHQAAMGKVGHYTDEGRTWYFKSTINFFGVSNLTRELVPKELSDTSDRQTANSVGAIDVGFIPGYAYVNRLKNWRFSVLAGLGGVIQAKYYTKNKTTRSFLGVAPRIDLKLMIGYSRPKYFILLSSYLDFKSMKIQDLSYNQTYYNVRLTGGFRIKTKDKNVK